MPTPFPFRFFGFSFIFFYLFLFRFDFQIDSRYNEGLLLWIHVNKYGREYMKLM